MGAPGASRFFRFGVFQLDLRARELRRSGVKVRVPDQSMQVLAMLLADPGEVVTREAVQQKLWPNGTIVEFDHSINAAIKRLRQALEDSAETPKFIETLPRLGYRFIGPVQPARAEEPVPSDTPEASPGGREGETVSHYRVVKRIGGGAMGVVYQAEDTRLGRTVALKFLPDEFAGDKASLERFQCEGRAASALNHPNICTLYDIGQVDGHPFLAMELLEGQTLLELITAGPLPVGKILDIGIQISDALEAAHAKGIVHRDIKPSNIFVTAGGPAKIMDFGLAQLVSERANLLPSKAVPAEPRKNPGPAVGTAAYMSPEQVRAEELDPRTDLFSFGVVLYEMAAGQGPFLGNTTAKLFDAILHNAPVPPAHLNPQNPPKLEEIIDKALEKDRAMRYQHAADLGADLKRLKRDAYSEWTAGVEVAAWDSAKTQRSKLTRGSSAVQPKLGSTQSGLIVALGVLLGILLGVAGGLFLKSPVPTAGPLLTQLTTDSGLTTDPALSPDGKLLAYASDFAGKGSLDIWVRQISAGAPVQITHDGLNNREPSFSPDGSMIVFSSERARGGIYVVPALGGEPRQVADQGRRPRFSPDGKQVVYWSGNDIDAGPRDSQRILVVPAAGGSPRLLSSGFLSARSPVWSPDGKRILFLGEGHRQGTDESLHFDWWVVPATGGLPTPLHVWGALPRLAIYPDPAVWTPDQKIIFTANLGDARNAWRVVIARDGNRLIGPAENLTVSGAVETSVSWAGSRLAFAAEKSAIDLWSIPADTNRGLVRGDMQRMTRNAGSNFYPTASSDGSRLVFRSDRRGSSEVWFKDFKTGREIPVFGSVDGHIPFLSADGATLMYTSYETKSVFSDRSEPVWAKYSIATYLIDIRPDGSFGVPQKACTDCNNPMACSSNARTLLFSNDFPQRDTYSLDVKTGQKRKVLESVAPMIVRTRFSQDDKWIAFVLRRGSAFTIFVAAYDGNLKREDQWVAITDGRFADLQPYWSPDGGLLYFYSDRDGSVCLWAQRLEPDSKHPIGQPVAVQHFHTQPAIKSVPLIQRGMSLTHDRIILTAGEATGNIWMAEYSAK